LKSAAPSLAGTQPTPKKSVFYFATCPKCSETTEVSGAAQGTPQVEYSEREAYRIACKGWNMLASTAHRENVELWPVIEAVAKILFRMVPRFLDSHLPGAPAQPGPEEKK